jgi:hypothetical protein
MSIEAFRPLDKEVVLMNHTELNIKRVAALPGQTHKQRLVYVETQPMAMTGLYKSNAEQLEDAKRRHGYVSEEYGLYNGSHKIKRSEYDDGGTMINVRLVDITGSSELRTRFLTPYNFIIAAQASPINNVRYDQRLVMHLNFALNVSSSKALADIEHDLSFLPILSG